jgi:hypothetical protein
MRKHSGKRQEQQARLRRKAERRAKREARRPKASTMRRDQRGVAKRLMAGEVPLVMASAWGLVEGVLDFLSLIGFWEVLDIDGQRFKRKMVSVCQLLATYELKVLLGIVSINQVGSKLFREVALLRLVGDTTQQLKGGLCKRGYGENKPMHGTTLANAIERLTERELDWLLQQTAARLVKRQRLWRSDGHYALDASDMLTSAKFKGTGRRTTSERRKTSDGKWVEIPKTVYGLKVIIVYEVKLRLVVAAKVVKIQDSELNYTLELVEQARRNLGQSCPIRVLLADRGFLDGQTLWTLKHELHVDWVIPVRTNMDIAADARQLARQRVDNVYISAAHRPAAGKGGRGQVTLRGVFDLSTFSTYGDEAHQHTLNRADFRPNLVNAVVVTHWRGSAYASANQPVFATSLDVSQPLQGCRQAAFRGPFHETASAGLRVGMVVGRTLGQDMPDHDQQFTGNGDDGFVLAYSHH